MSGDLGNLLTGEMGEAESRFSDEDFAEAYGRRVMGRVRRRRAVRAVGVGGGTVLTAGALAVGATHMPWGVLGAAPGNGIGSSGDCATPSPSDGWYSYEVNVREGGTPQNTVSLIDANSGVAIFTAVAQPDGSYRFTDADGNPLKATAEASGNYRVTVSRAPMANVSWTAPPPGSAEIQVVGISTSGFANSIRATTSPSDDCYTPSPTPSGAPHLTTDIYPVPNPSLAAKPEDVTSPFQCGFAMDSLGHGSSQIAITDTTWRDPAAYNATLTERLGTSVDLPLELGSASVPTVRVRVDPDATGRWGSVFVVGEPTDAMAVSADGTPMVDSGASFVMVRDGVVVAIMDTATQSLNRHVGFWYDGATNSQELTLVNASDAFIACPGQALESTTGTVFAVAGSYVKDKSGVNSTSIDYSWTALEPN